MVKNLLILPILFSLSSCSLILNGTSQNVAVTTIPEGARCELYREGKVLSSIASTPGGTLINKTKHDITLTCEKDGYQKSSTELNSGLESAVYGNILLGGLIGWGFDSATGADNRYPDQTLVALIPAATEAISQIAPVEKKIKTKLGQKQAPAKPIQNEETELEDRLKELKNYANESN